MRLSERHCRIRNVMWSKMEVSLSTLKWQKNYLSSLRWLTGVTSFLNFLKSLRKCRKTNRAKQFKKLLLSIVGILFWIFFKLTYLRSQTVISFQLQPKEEQILLKHSIISLFSEFWLTHITVINKCIYS